MKKNRYFFAAAAILLCTLLTGCSNPSVERTKSGELILNTVEQTAETAYRSNNIELASKPDGIYHVCPLNEGFVLSGRKGNLPVMYCFSTDGSLIQSFDLSWLEESQSISNLTVSEDGTLYILTGTDKEEGFSYQLYAIPADGQAKLISGLNIDNGVYIGDMFYCNDALFFRCTNYQLKSYYLEAYTCQGQKKQSYDIGKPFSCVSDGKAIYIGLSSIDGIQLKKLDPDRGSLSDLETFSSGHILGAADGKIYIGDLADVFCFDTSTNEISKLFQWASNGAIPSSKLCPLPDGNFIIWSSDSIRLVQARAGDESPSQEIVLALNGMPLEFSNVIIHFNDENNGYHITIKDYSAYSDPVQILATEINAGNAPDLIDTFAFSSELINTGALENLLPYFEADPDISASDLLQAPLRAMLTEDQALLGIAPSFLIWTFTTGAADNINFEGQTIAENLEALGNPADAFAGTLARDTFLSLAFCCGINKNYSVEDIAAILEWAKQLPETENYNMGTNISEGTQRILALNCCDHDSWWVTRQLFGGKAGDMVLLGLPFSDGTGIIVPSCRIAIPSAAGSKAGAWTFIKYLLLQEFGSYSTSAYCPILSAEYKRICAEDTEAIAQQKQKINGEILEDASHIGEFDVLLNGINGMYQGNTATYDIVISCSARYFSGQIGAQEAAQDILSRLGVYYAEHQ